MGRPIIRALYILGRPNIRALYIRAWVAGVELHVGEEAPREADARRHESIPREVPHRICRALVKGNSISKKKSTCLKSLHEDVSARLMLNVQSTPVIQIVECHDSQK